MFNLYNVTCQRICRVVQKEAKTRTYGGRWLHTSSSWTGKKHGTRRQRRSRPPTSYTCARASGSKTNAGHVSMRGYKRALFCGRSFLDVERSERTEVIHRSLLPLPIIRTCSTTARRARLGLVYFLPKTQNFSRFSVTSNL